MSNGESTLAGRERAESYESPPALYLKADASADRVLEPGQVFSGRIEGLTTASRYIGDKKVMAPVVTAREIDPETGEPLELWALWLWHQVPQAQFREKGPQVGDVFHLKRLEDGQSDAYGEYVKTHLVLEGEAGEDFSWPGQDAEGGPEVDPETGEILDG